MTSDVRKMSDEELLQGLWDEWRHDRKGIRVELASRLSILREYYESHMAYFQSSEVETPEVIARMKAAEDACREMEAEHE